MRVAFVARVAPPPGVSITVGEPVVRTSGVDEHHGLLRYTWRIVAANGKPIVDGTDFGELAPDDRLQRIAEFDDPAPTG
jgi:hypothetical protein